MLVSQLVLSVSDHLDTHDAVNQDAENITIARQPNVEQSFRMIEAESRALTTSEDNDSRSPFSNHLESRLHIILLCALSWNRNYIFVKRSDELLLLPDDVINETFLHWLEVADLLRLLVYYKVLMQLCDELGIEFGRIIQ